MSTTLELSTNAGKSASTPAASAPVAMTDPGSYKPRAGRYEVKDAVVPGLRLIVQTNGKKSWALRYSQKSEYRKMTFGPWPLIPLAEDAVDKKARLARDPASIPPDARGLARHWLGLKATGVDIAEEWDRQHKADPAAKDQAEAHLVKVQWEKFLVAPRKKLKGPMRTSSRKRFESLFALTLATWDKRTVQSIGKSDCLDAIDEAGKRGDHAAASLSTVLGAFFTWLESRGTIDKSPMKTIAKITIENVGERTLTDDDIKSLWNATGKLGAPFGPMFRLLLLTGQRRTEVAAMRFSQINFADKEWHIPSASAKNAAPHVVHLSDAAMTIIESISRIDGCDFVFTTDGKTYSKGFSKAKSALDKLMPGVAEWRLHDLRRTVGTRLAKGGVPLQVAEKILNHGKGTLSGLAGRYNLYEYADERRAAMNAWAMKLDRIINPDAASNVVELRSPEAVA
jgi:integrase